MDGAPVMLRNKSGFAGLVKERFLITRTHCFLHRHALASRTLHTFLKDIMSTCVRTVNFIGTRSLKRRTFKKFLSENGIRAQSSARSIQYDYCRSVEVSLFLKENFSVNSLYEPFGSEDFVQRLAYLAYIFNHLYKINLSL